MDSTPDTDAAPTTTDSAETGTQTVLAGIDGSPQARRALMWAAQWAADRDAELTILLASMSDSRFGDRSPEDIEQQVAAEVEAVLAQHPDLEVESEIRDDPPQAAMVRASRSADLAVVGARGVGGWQGLKTGTLANRLPAHAHCPVVIVPENVKASSAEGPVVVGYDGSRPAAAAVRFAVRQAKAWGVELIALIADPPSHNFGKSRIPVPEDQQTEEQQAYTRTLHDLGEEYETEIDVRHLHTRPATALIEQMGSASMVVLGRTGQGSSTLMGSTARAVVQAAACPVTVVAGDAATR